MIILPGGRRAAPADDPLLEFLREKAPSGPLETTLCLADWVRRVAGRPWVSALEVQALSRRVELRPLLTPLRCASDAMRTATRVGLLAPWDDDGAAADLPARAARYAVSALGQAVVAALPDRALVRSVRCIRRGTRRRQRALRDGP